MKFWIVGRYGLLSKDLQKLLKSRKIDFIATSKSDLDYQQPKTLEKFMVENGVTHIVNAAGYTDVDACEVNREHAYMVNVDIPRKLAKLSTLLQTRFVHISSDYVFASDTYRVFKEEEGKNPCNYYGYTKALAEDAVIANNSDSIILRTSWLYGESKSSFIIERLKDIVAGKTVSLICDNFGSPTKVTLLSCNILKMLEEDNCAGIYHVSSLGFTSWYDLGVLARSISGSDSQIQPISYGDLSRTAKRSRWSVLDHTRTSISGYPSLVSWQEGLREYLYETH